MDKRLKELDSQIELFEHRVETMTEYISDTNNAEKRSTMQGQLSGYSSTLQNLREERRKRLALLESGAIAQGGIQKWCTKNLDVNTYRNGDIIPEVQDAAEWKNLTTGAWCFYENKTENGVIYGKLYNWYAVNDPRGLAPEGYHIPSDEEWETYINFLGGEKVAGGKMKEEGSAHWGSPNNDATNESGFTALPGYSRHSDGLFHKDLGSPKGEWWSSTEDNSELASYMTEDGSKGAFCRVVFAYYGSIVKSSGHKRHGFSVRCIAD